MVAMQPFAVHVALDHHRLHVVVQNLTWHAAERGEGPLVTGDQRGHLHVTDELDVAGAAVAHRGAERVQRRAAFAELDPIHLQLLAHRRLEAHLRLNRQRRAQ